MGQSPPHALESLWRKFFIGAILVFLIALLHQHAQIILATIPLDLYEGQMPLITGIIAEGHNPYARQYQPAAMDVYPPLYNMLVAPLTLLFGNSLQLHRSVSAVFIAIACLLCFIATYRLSRSGVYSAAASVTFYAALLFYSTPIASTNALGVALFMAVIVVPWLYQFSNRSLLVALVCAVLAFYAKQYFILAMAILCLYLFLYYSMARALVLGFTFAACLLASLIIVHYTSPYFLDNVVFGMAIAQAILQMPEQVAAQLTFYIKTYWALLLLLAIVAAHGLFAGGYAAPLRRASTLLRLDRSGLNGPLLRHPLGYFSFGFFWATAAIVVVLGRNPGNFMTYLFQLMSPFLLIGGFATLSQLRGKLALCLPLLLLVFYQTYAILPKDFSTTDANWKKVNELISQHDDILASQMLLMSLLDQDKKIYQDGHTFYFPLAKDKPRSFRHEREEDRIEVIWENYITQLYRKVERKQFGLIIVSPWDFNGIFRTNPPPYKDIDGPSYLKQFYTLDETFPLSMTDRYGGGTYRMQVWRPKP